MKKTIGLLLALGLYLPMAAQATLVGILPTTAGGTNYQAYYDTTTNLTWLADANANGQMTWSNANSWAAGLSVTGYVGGTQKTVSGWGLPTMAGTSCSGYNCTGSEMGHLYYDTLGNLGYCDTSGNCPQTGWGLKHTGPFSNVQSYLYWSATEYAPNTGYAWYFDFGFGIQGFDDKTNSQYAWAVRAGDPGAATSVPAPGSLWLMGAGVALLGLMLGRRWSSRGAHSATPRSISAADEAVP